ncbi:MAG TPA: protein kinase [Candidatus Krumholzibacteria bacterium]|nr:protein kinase [Candidatus Krumholzibacteria bacterium]
MQIKPGSKLGSYDVVSMLGAGGMGEVFRARDTRLGRDVAIKAMPEGFAQDPERLGRFEREARLLASLNHPNIAAIHGVEEAGGERYLVLEFVDGESLAARIARGALPVDEAIEICRDIAAGVEAAHENGVIHRDLKPGNVMITPDGTVKVLDFGLATSGSGGSGGSSSDLTRSPTLTSPATRAGVILGTAAYMSPEQARGRSVDRRTDIWSFGCVLYECLTGTPMYEGETVSDLIARILERDPNWEALPANTPVRVRELLKRCLRKDPKERLRDIGDARLELMEARAGAGAVPVAAAPAARKRPFAWMIATGVLLAALAASIVIRPAPKLAQEHTMRLSVPLPPGLQVSLEVPDAVVSPDGQTLLFAASDTTGTTRLYVRKLDAAVVRPVPGTEGAVIPFWSPDSRQIAFFADGSLKRMGIDGAGTQVICPAPAPRGGDWGPGDVILFQPNASGPIMRIPASGGTPVPATTLDPELKETAHRFPSFLPDGKHFLYVALPGPDGVPQTRTGSLDGDTGPVLLTSLSRATYSEPGYLLFNQNESVVAQPFDAASRTAHGTPQLVPDLYNTAGQYSGSPIVTASADGKLVQRELNLSGMAIVLTDRSGRVTRRLSLPPGKYSAPRFSPDGKRLAVTHCRVDEYEEHLWVVDLARSLSTRFAFDGDYDIDPRWTVDGSRIVWGSDRADGRDLYWKRSDGAGAEELLVDAPGLFNDPTSVTSQYVLFRSLSGETNEDIWIAPLAGDGEAKPFVLTPFDEIDAVVSPNERWVAYRSNESGRFELYVTSFPEPGSKTRISDTGAQPTPNVRPVTVAWRGDGRELYYVGGDGRTLMVVDVDTGVDFHAGNPRPLLRLPRETIDAAVAPDGQLLAVIVPAETNARSIINLVVNWSAEMK